jgi:hypothetical protein
MRKVDKDKIEIVPSPAEGDVQTKSTKANVFIRMWNAFKRGVVKVGVTNGGHIRPLWINSTLHVFSFIWVVLVCFISYPNIMKLLIDPKTYNECGVRDAINLALTDFIPTRLSMLISAGLVFMLYFDFIIIWVYKALVNMRKRHSIPSWVSISTVLNLFYIIILWEIVYAINQGVFPKDGIILLGIKLNTLNLAIIFVFLIGWQKWCCLRASGLSIKSEELIEM